MAAFVLRRVAQAVFALWVVLTLVFAIVHVIGNPIAVLAPEGANVQQLAVLRHALGLDASLPVQYARYFVGVLHGNLGISYYTGTSALPLLASRFPVTLELVLAAMGLSVLFGFPFGVASALSAGGQIDRSLRFVSVLGASTPSFFLGILLIFVFSVNFNLLPPSGWGSVSAIIMPAFTLAFFRISLFTRLVRAGLLDELSQDYVRTARAKGLPAARVIWKHAMRTTAIPLVTVFGLQFGELLGGAVVTESIFALPGMNRMALQAIYRLDYPVIIAYVVLIAALFSAINLIVDVLYGILDPRVAYA